MITPVHELLGQIGVAHIVTAVATINICTFAAFGIDKICAEMGLRRISEATLLKWAAIAGTPGAYAGRHLFRHKTRKQPFSDNLALVALVQAAAVAAAICGWIILS